MPGTAKMVRLVNDEGNLVYGVRVMTSAGNGNVLQVKEGKTH